MRTTRGGVLKLLSFANWAILTLAVLASLVGAVICLLMWPFPQTEDSGGLADVWIGTQLGLGVSLVATLATWLTDKRHPLFWVAEIVLAIAVVAALIYGLALR
ncbi:hypothetical protein V5738_08290 [Salinisphaera sp. SPP-AMP-43]|uniref:hypothetical protein n=1 Tax=Salinisphaera sp. SPP-AMP-43 TaxID=3121288 RepID=UPI003C6E5827